MHTYSFEKLNVFVDTKNMVNKIYIATASYPSNENYNLTNQLRRASVSILANLAEGTSRRTKKDQSHFTTMSYSSLMEVLSLLIISRDQKMISDKNYYELRLEIEKISNKLNALRKSQLITS